MMNGRALRVIFPALILLSPYWGEALAANPIGDAAQVVNQVTGVVELTTHEIKKLDKVHQDEAITTGEHSATQLTFEDDTLLTLGPRSEVVLDKFVYDPNDSTGSMVVSVTTGAFRFVSGKLDSESYQIETPTATMGIRGTEFDVVVEEDGETTVNVNEGEVELSNLAGDAILISAGYTSSVAPAPIGAPQDAPSALADEPSDEFKERIAEMDELTEGFFGGPNTAFARYIMDMDWTQISGWTAAALFLLPLATGGITAISVTGAIASGAIILWMLLG